MSHQRTVATVVVGFVGAFAPSAGASAATAITGAFWQGPAYSRTVAEPSSDGTTDTYTLEDLQLATGVSLGVRLRHVALGVNANTSGTIFGRGENFFAPYAGWTTTFDRLRFAVVAEFGRHSVYDLGNGLLSEGTSTPAVLPFVGVRAATAHAFGVGKEFLLGMWLTARRDIGNTSAPTLGCFGNCGPWEVGGSYFAIGIQIGFDIEASITASPTPDVPTDPGRYLNR